MSTIVCQALINGALQDLGRIAPGESPNQSASAAGLLLVIEIISSWSRDGQITYVEKLGSANLQPGVIGYTIGVAGTFNSAAYPQRVKGGTCSYSGFQQGVTVMPMKDFQERIANEIGMTAALIKLMGVDNAAPQRNLRVFPTPNVQCTVELSWFEPITLPVLLTDNITFPVEGWEAALRAELVVALCPSYGLEATTTMGANMQRLKARITDTGTSLLPQPPQPPQQ